VGARTALAPGEIAWTFLTGTDDQEVRFVEDGWVWRQAGDAAIVAADPAGIVEGLPEWPAVEGAGARW